jgi:hypothetical protein
MQETSKNANKELAAQVYSTDMWCPFPLAQNWENTVKQLQTYSLSRQSTSILSDVISDSKVPIATVSKLMQSSGGSSRTVKSYFMFLSWIHYVAIK